MQGNSCTIISLKAIKTGFTTLTVTYRADNVAIKASITVGAYEPLVVSTTVLYSSRLKKIQCCIARCYGILVIGICYERKNVILEDEQFVSQSTLLNGDERVLLAFRCLVVMPKIIYLGYECAR